MKRIGWLTLPLLLGTFITLHVETDERVPPESIPLREMKVMTRAIHFIEKNYVDPASIDPFRMIERASRALERNIAPLLIKEREGKIEVHLGDKNVTLPLRNPLSLDDIPPFFSRLLGFLEMFYQDPPDEKERLSLTLSGMIDTLDPHSNYLPPKVYNEFKIGTKGNFGGLGIVIGIREGDLTVISPLEGTPAFEAGIKAKDKIIQIGEEATINMGLTEAVEKLRGPPGSKVSLVINRTGIAAPLKFNLTRAVIKIQSVGGKILRSRKIVLLKIKNFQEDTWEEFTRTFRSFTPPAGGWAGLILDLRNNPGGLLDQAITLADYFLEKGTIVKTVGAHGETLENEEARPGDGGEGIPVVVLVNEGSASASEIVAGAFQFNDRAVVIGNRTFGKGSVQTVYDLKDGSALKLTIAKYLTAADHPVQSIGINPDIGLVPASIDEKVVDLFEDIKRRELDLEEEGGEERKDLHPADLPPPPLQMTYLASGKKEEEESSGRIELEDDFPVQLAERILELPESRGGRRGNLLKAIPDLLEKMRGEESEKIRLSMSKIGIDWSGGDRKGRPSGTIKVDILDEQENPSKGLSPGESGFLRVIVENRGSAPFHQLAGVTRSEDPLFANLEFPFGKIAPREKREWKTALKTPDFIHPRSVPVEIEFHEEHDRIPKPFSFSMQTEEPPTPLFRYQYTLLDDGTRGTTGNGNKKAERGETVGLLVQVENIGKGESDSPVINLKNLEGQEVFLEKGREELSPLPAGGRSEALLRVRIPPKAPMEKLSFDLALFDNHLGEDLNDKLVIPLGKKAGEEAIPSPGTLQTPPSIEISPARPPLTSSGSSYPVKGRVEDDHQLRHLVLFVGNEKIMYQSAPAGEKSLAFEKTVSLKKGANLITLIATDDRNLTTRRQWIVWRTR